ncbi:MAG: hypothetical protein H7061_09530 [Bdellovibrionaceae bacterium]|nr:hypothetical protein [Bdellovibrio sp.]
MVRKLIWIFAGLTLSLQFAIAYVLRDLGEGAAIQIIKFQTTLDPNYFKSVLESWGPQGVQIFLRHYYFDFFYPIAYSGLLTVSIFIIFPRSRKLFIIPIVAGIFDIVENIAHISLIHNEKLLDTSVFYLGAISAILKWLLIILSLALIIFGVIRKAKRPATIS